MYESKTIKSLPGPFCWPHNYSQTCIQRPSKGDTEYDIYREVVFIWRLLCFTRPIKSYPNIVKPVNKDHPRERQNKVVIDKWPLFRGYFVLFYQERVIDVWSFIYRMVFIMWPLIQVWLWFSSQGGLYSEVVINTGLTYTE